MQPTVEAALFAAINVGGFGALVWSWSRFSAKAPNQRSPVWRRALAAWGLLLASFQAALLVVLQLAPSLELVERN